DHVKDLGGEASLGVELDDVGLFGGDNDADLSGSGGDHALHQVLGNSFRPLYTLDLARPNRQQFLRTSEGLDSQSRSGRWNHADHRALSLLRGVVAERASSRYLSSWHARTCPV